MILICRYFYIKKVSIMKIKFFNVVNISMALFCAGAMLFNHCDVNVLSAKKAVSSLNGESFEYFVSDNKFSVTRNGKLVGCIKTDRNFRFRNFMPSFQCNGVAVLGKCVVAGGAAAAAGGSFGAAFGAAGAGAIQTIVGGAAAVGGALVNVALPGAEIVTATLGGAGEIAATAAAEAAAAGAGTIAVSALAIVGGGILAGGILT
jgi:hypothetical protein